jgi:hypothetical protein
MGSALLVLAILWTSWLNNLGKEKPRQEVKERAFSHGVYRVDPAELEKKLQEK